MTQIQPLRVSTPNDTTIIDADAYPIHKIPGGVEFLVTGPKGAIVVTRDAAPGRQKIDLSRDEWDALCGVPPKQSVEQRLTALEKRLELVEATYIHTEHPAAPSAKAVQEALAASAPGRTPPRDLHFESLVDQHVSGLVKAINTMSLRLADLVGVIDRMEKR